jgi:hypothetical protein
VESPITRCSALGEQRHKVAQDPLDFRTVRSVCGGTKQEATMDHATIDPTIKIVLTEIHSKLNEAARIAKAAEACALAGSVAESVSVLMDFASMSARRCSEVARRLRGRSTFTPCSLLYAASSLHEAA